VLGRVLNCHIGYENKPVKFYGLNQMLLIGVKSQAQGARQIVALLMQVLSEEMAGKLSWLMNKKNLRG